MLKRYLRILKTYRTLKAVAMLMCCLPVARADIYVSSGSGGGVTAYSEYTGAFHMSFQLPSGALPPFSSGLAIGPYDGNIYVADEDNAAVVGFNYTTGMQEMYISLTNEGRAVPVGIAILSGGGALFVADNNGYIWEYQPGPPYLFMGKFSCTPPSGTQCYPVGLAIGPDGNLYVSDDGSRGILKFSFTGYTLNFLGQFVTPPSPNAFPSGLHFSPGANGNLYVDYALPVLNSALYYDDILEFSGPNNPSPGSPITLNGGAGIDYWGPQDFVFDPGGAIVTTQAYSFAEYSPSTGYWLANFGALNYPPEEIDAGFMAIGGPSCSFCTQAPPLQLYAPIGLDSGQHLRLTVIEGPVWVPPGVPVEIQLGFQNSQGAAVGPSQVFNLNPGQTASLDLDASTLISSGRIEIQPVVTAAPGNAAPMAIINGSAEVYSDSSGFGSIFYAGVPASGGSQVAGPPSFLPQGVALGQSIQINALAPPDSPCMAMLSFTDDNGNPIGPKQQVNLSPGQMASLSFNPNKYTKSGRQEYVPQLTPNNPSGGESVAPACLGSAEVYSTKIGSTETYQTSSPAVGTMSPSALQGSTRAK